MSLQSISVLIAAGAMAFFCVSAASADPFTIEQAGPVYLQSNVISSSSPSDSWMGRAYSHIQHCMAASVDKKHPGSQPIDINKLPDIQIVLALGPQGNITGIALDPDSQARYRESVNYRNLVFATLLMVKRCGPIEDFPKADYAKWKTLHVRLGEPPKELLP